MSYLGLDLCLWILCCGFEIAFNKHPILLVQTTPVSPSPECKLHVLPRQENRIPIAKCELRHSQLKAAWVLAIFFKLLSLTWQFEVKWNPSRHLWESSFFHYKLEQKGSWHKGANETYLKRNIVWWTSNMHSFLQTNKECVLPKK